MSSRPPTRSTRPFSCTSAASTASASSSGEKLTTHRRATAPLCAAGFVTAFGSHGVAANLGVAEDGLGRQLLVLGLLLALYDGAEVLLKPLFGVLADRIGPRPVLLGGLAGFALASLAFALAATPVALGAARFAQGAAASAFSPAASTLLARLAPERGRGTAFGTYGAWKSLGYTAGPLLGGVLVAGGGFGWLFGALTALALLVGAWAAVAVPALAPLPRHRQSVADLLRGLTDRRFLTPVVALAVSAAALSCGVGFLPLIGAGAGLGPVATGAAVSVLAVAATATQPVVGRLRDRGRLGDRAALVAGTVVTAAGLAVAAAASVPVTAAADPVGAGLVGAGLVGAALVGSSLLIGIGTGALTPVAFAVLAAGAPPGRVGQTMGSAEVGREVGEFGGPVVIGGLAAAGGLATGFVGVAVLVGVAALSASAA